MGWNYLLVIYILSLLLCSLGFFKYVYFISIGYGFAIAGGGIAILILALMNGWAIGLEWMLVVQTLLFIAYGMRLSSFLIVRDIKNFTYRKFSKEVLQSDKKFRYLRVLQFG